MLGVQIATHFVTLGFFCLLLPLVIITPEVRPPINTQECLAHCCAKPSYTCVQMADLVTCLGPRLAPGRLADVNWTAT